MMPLEADRRATTSIGKYRTDPLYPKVVRVVSALLERGQVVAPVDVLMGKGLLTADGLEDWRRGRVPYLEKVIRGSLPRLSRLLRILRLHAHDVNLTASATVYMRHGKGPRRRLRFTTSGDAMLEQAYALHFVWPGKEPFHAPITKETPE